METNTIKSKTEVRRLDPSETHEKRSEMVIVDVRTPAEFQELHIEGSVSSPLSDFDAGEAIRLADAAAVGCVLVCLSGGRAQQAAQTLLRSGMTPERIHLLEGGIQAWESRGLPLIRGKKAISLERQVRIAAGALVVMGAALGFFVNPVWIGISAFVGLGLVFAGITDTCGMGMLLARMPWNQR
jgi:rhodanese-related sulfurtransferase